MESGSSLELLRRHAPILRYDGRELFHPIAVEGYTEGSTLWGPAGELRPAGALTVDDLDHRLPPGTYLKFVSDAERRAVLREEASRVARQLLTPRLGRVGLFGRILDALFLASLLLRSTVPRLTTAAAKIKAEKLGLEEPEPVCYGRVVREGEWLVLHYAYFYAMNDWRTSYRGLNDHEADWEQSFIYLDPADEQPVWVAATSHDYYGPDLRRHWDDPELLVVDGRPVLHPGAGSHALFFRPGDYVTRIDVPALRWVLRVQRWFQRLLRIRDEADVRGLGPALGAPFVDAATGDGREIATWDLRMLDEDQPWAWEFRGLWGLDTGDQLGGERGPSGPKFDRDGHVRQSWADPIGFAGLHGVLPPSARARRVNQDKLKKAIGDLDDEIRQRGRRMPLVEQTGLPDQTSSQAAELTSLLRQRTELEDLQRQLENGVVDSSFHVRAHLRHAAVPLPPPRESGFVLAAWAAVSIPLVLWATAAVFLFRVGALPLAWAIAGLAAGVTMVEQIVRRRFQAVLRLTVLLGATAAFVLFVLSGVIANSGYALGALLAVAGTILFVSNLGELRAVQHYRSMAADQRARYERREAELASATSERRAG